MVGKALGEGEGVPITTGLAEGELNGVAPTAFLVGTLTPLLHTIFLPDLMQVYRRPEDVVLSPNLVHAEPVLEAA